MDLGERQFVSVVEAIYDSAVASDKWPTALARLCDSCGGGQGILLQHDLTLGNGVFTIAVGQEPRWTAAYNSYYAARNPWGYHRVLNRDRRREHENAHPHRISAHRCGR